MQCIFMPAFICSVMLMLSLARTPYGGDFVLRAREVLTLDVAWWKLPGQRGL